MTELTKLFHAYRDSFNRNSVRDLVNLIELPLFINHCGNKLLITDETSLVDTLQTLLSAYKAKKFSHAAYEIISTYVLSNTNLLATLKWHLTDIDDKVFSSFTCHYHCIKNNDIYKISGIINLEEDIK